MPDDARMTCAEFQSLLPTLLISDEPIDNHPHYKTCLICRDLIRNHAEMIDKAFPAHTDDWSEST
jgi:hypothetical protein